MKIILITLFLADMCAYYASGNHRFKKRIYLIPLIGGWLALWGKLNHPS